MGAQADAGRDVVIVGGGIAGASLAAALAGAGLAVEVLEATERFEDRVRGESMMPWGLAEAAGLGVAGALLAAGAHVAPVWRRYSEGSSEPREIPVGCLVPGAGGTLNLAHPVACQALLDQAEAAGATVQRGVRRVSVTLGAAGPELGFDDRLGRRIERRPALVAGADGRASAVRRTAGIGLESAETTDYVAGLLLEGVAGPSSGGEPPADVMAEHAHGLCLLTRQGGGRARAYHVVPPALRLRYAGAGGPQRFIADLAGAGVDELAAAVARARPAGPCAAFPGTDTWADTPYADGVVLVGDAAGHSDPAIGCGLSIALRDVRLVRDLVLAGARTAADFAPYGDERRERMRRLRLVARLVISAAVDPAGDRSARRRRLAEASAAFDPTLFPLLLAMFAGPETIPAELVDDGVIDHLRAA
ncbi:MAG: FAD-dependent monooxygenase [Acidimicrobiales bacterium]